MSNYKYDPEFYEALKPILDGPPKPEYKDVFELRNFSNNLFVEMNKDIAPDPDVQRTTWTVPSYDGHQVPVTLFRSNRASSQDALPAVVFIHGGGMSAGSVELYGPSIEALASRSGVPVFAMDYRLAPEHPAPAGLEDAYAVLAHVSAGAASYGVDPARITVYGDSAGGLISSSVALAARDRGLSPPLAKQILIYPTLDDRPAAKGDEYDSSPLSRLLVWRGSDHKLVWSAYLGREDHADAPDDQIPEHAVPARAKSLAGLPPVYIEIGTLDMFLEENLAYVQRLLRDGVQVEMHIWPGLPHGWELAGGISWMKRATESRMSAIERIGK